MIMVELPKKSDDLAVVFKSAAVPDLSDFTGKYYVNMLTGLPSLRRLGHHKIFYTVDNEALGYNVVLRRWGHFRLEMGVLEEDGLGFLMLDYGVDRNTFLTRGIRDQVRCIEPGSLYLGRTNLLLRSKLRFVGYFTLSRE